MAVSIRNVDYNGGNYGSNVQNEMTLEIDLTDVNNDPRFDVTAANETEFYLRYHITDVDRTIVPYPIEYLTSVTGQLLDPGYNGAENSTVRQLTSQVLVSRTYIV